MNLLELFDNTKLYLWQRDEVKALLRDFKSQIVDERYIRTQSPFRKILSVLCIKEFGHNVDSIKEFLELLLEK